MNALTLTLFVSISLGVLAVGGFIYAVRGKDMDHNDRLSLLPLEEDAGASPIPSPAPFEGTAPERAASPGAKP